MTIQEQIAAIRAALTAIETAMTQTEAAVRMASVPADIMALTATLADLRVERARLQFQLANLQAAVVVVEPLPFPAARAAARRRGGEPSRAEMRAIQKKLNTAVTDRRIVEATIAFAGEVKDLAATVRMIGDDLARSRAIAGEEPTRPRPRKTRKRRRSAPRRRPRSASMTRR